MTSASGRAVPSSPLVAAPVLETVGRAARERAAHPGLIWVRMLLLVSLLFGVAAMHTLGHPPEDGHQPASSFTVAAHPAPAPEKQADSDSPVMDPTSMCLAIVGMVAALIGLAAVVFVPWPGPLLRPPSSLRRSVVRVVRPDPPSLARLQVLRV
ncbi:DUF6153 family protein [Nocardiopsis halotolerans]|uniref:DUF6153 family protein n=1 Tax=Nocardiopsis halotolerans TaxID=124252 RepID=UPI000369F0FD|nr:DUF6153 family protein [Nocardiopsis halotolerans]